MQLIRVNYISDIIADRLCAMGGAEAIVAHAALSNPAQGITGALIVTTTQFAQTIEGPADATRNLMGRLRHDPRHRILLEFGSQPIAVPRFVAWNLVYSGPSTYISRIVERVLSTSTVDPDLAASRLLSLMAELANGRQAG